MDDCCRKGFRWDGTPVGKEETLGDCQAYVTGTNTQRAVLFCHDGMGWAWVNARLLADHFAQEAGATVYIPDLYVCKNPLSHVYRDLIVSSFDGGKGISADAVKIRHTDTGSVEFEMSKDFDWQGWMEKFGVEVRMPQILACARLLRDRYAKLGAVGYCWGGQAGFQLASKTLHGLFDCVSIAHPGPTSEETIRNVGVPLQILAPEHDPTFPRPLQDLSNTEIPKNGVDYCFQYFPGMIHGFASKCDEKKEQEKKALEMAKNAVVFWLASHL